MSIRYLNHQEIDIEAWDKCITGSFNASIYAFSWYLDLVCDSWNCLVEDDYQSVMPLPVSTCMGIPVIIHPAYVSELGIFSVVPITRDKTRAFLEAIPSSFGYYRIVLNKYNPVNLQDYHSITHSRFELDLIRPYAKITASYEKRLQQQLQLPKASGFSFIRGLSPNDLIRFIKDHHIRLPRAVSARNYQRLRMIMASLVRYKSGELFGVYDEHNELASVALFNWINNQINLAFQVVSTDIISVHAHLFLIDKFVEKYSETNTILVFGSLVKEFYPLPYNYFGARETSYTEIICNKLPFPIKYFL